jgi:penicillin-binding protein 2A
VANRKPAKPKAKKPGKRRFSYGKLFIAMAITAAIAIVCALIGYMVIIYNGQKIFNENKDKMDMMEASIIYDINDKEVSVLGRENRELVDKSEIPKKVSYAFIATEDKRFEQHAGVDFWAIGRALVKDVIARSAVEGGSTITQQLAKNLFLDFDKTFFRKGTEMSIALALEENLDKDEIMELYLNRIYFGKGAYGIKAASKYYFGKSDLNQLETWEIATLAAIPKAPAIYSPLGDAERSKERRNVVLKLMYDQGYITEAEKNKAQGMEYVPPAQKTDELLTFKDYVIREAAEKYKLEEEVIRRGGYKIYTTMNVDAQRILETAFKDPKFFQKDGPEQKMQGSMVIVDNKEGGIVAMSGGRDYAAKGLNRALVQRQPGSAFKPLISYAPAMELQSSKYNPYTLLPDEQKSYGNYSPRNYDGVYKGEVTMTEAVRKSINAPAVWLLNEIGVGKARDFVKKMGIPTESQDNNLAIALGGLTKGVTPLAMAQAYSAFPNNGMMNTAYSIRKIVDSEGSTVASVKQEKTKVMSPKTAYYMTEMLKGVVSSGTGTAAKLNRPVAGKTGTTQLDLKGLEKNNRDVWFVGYSAEWTAAVWMGFDKTDAKHYVLPASGSFPAALFKEVMNKALTNVAAKDFVKPSDVPSLTEPPKSVDTLKAEYVKDALPKVELTWTGDADNSIGAYQIFRKESKEQEFRQISEQLKGTFKFVDITIKAGESYEYYVVPYNTQSNQAGEKSNVVAVQIPADTAVSPSPSVSPGGSQSPGGSIRPSGSPNRTPGPSGSVSPSPTPSTSSSGSAKPSPEGSKEPQGSSNEPSSSPSPSPSQGARVQGEGSVNTNPNSPSKAPVGGQ